MEKKGLLVLVIQLRISTQPFSTLSCIQLIVLQKLTQPHVTLPAQMIGIT